MFWKFSFGSFWEFVWSKLGSYAPTKGYQRVRKGSSSQKGIFHMLNASVYLSLFFPILFFSKVLIIKNPNPLREVNNKYSHCAHLFFLSQLHSEPLESTFFVKIQLQRCLSKELAMDALSKVKLKKCLHVCIGVTFSNGMYFQIAALLSHFHLFKK